MSDSTNLTRPTDPEHLDPGRVPPWLMESARKHDPQALGWLAAGYLAGVEVGRKAGPCTATVESRVGRLVCGLAHGHVGGHATASPVTWTDADPEPEVSP